MKDKAPPINLSVDCSAFDASPRPSGSSMGTTTSTQNEYASPDSGGSDDFNPVTDEAPQINMDVNCSVFDATRGPSRSTAYTAPSTQCGDETAHHARDLQDPADNVADHEVVQEVAHRDTAAANMRQPVAHPPIAQGHDLLQNSLVRYCSNMYKNIPITALVRLGDIVSNLTANVRSLERSYE